MSIITLKKSSTQKANLKNSINIIQHTLNRYLKYIGKMYVNHCNLPFRLNKNIAYTVKIAVILKYLLY